MKSKLLNLALKIAQEAHKGKFRFDGVTPFVSHPIAVAKAFTNKIFYVREMGRYGFLAGKTYLWHSDKNELAKIQERLQVVALLHDVVEDSDITIGGLICKGIPLEIANDVVILTRIKGENYLNYILKIKEHKLLTLIKKEDIKHNLSTLSDKYKSKRDKYLLALYILKH